MCVCVCVCGCTPKRYMQCSLFSFNLLIVWVSVGVCLGLVWVGDLVLSDVCDASCVSVCVRRQGTCTAIYSHLKFDWRGSR